MIGLEPLYDFVSLCIWTGAVFGERPASAIIIGPPGSGKTTVLERMRGPHAPFVTDLTSREISAIIRDNPEASHILLSDMMAVFSHRASVTNLVCSTLGALTGDSLRNDPFSGAQLNNGGKKIGLITAIPPYDLETNPKVKDALNGAGFATRFMQIHFDYSADTKLKIHEYIRLDRYTEKTEHAPFELPKTKSAVYIPPELAQDIQTLSLYLKPSTDTIGTRIHLHLRSLCKARALRDGRDAANADDIQCIAAYGDFFKQGKIL